MQYLNSIRYLITQCRHQITTVRLDDSFIRHSTKLHFKDLKMAQVQGILGSISRLPSNSLITFMFSRGSNFLVKINQLLYSRTLLAIALFFYLFCHLFCCLYSYTMSVNILSNSGEVIWKFNSN